MISFILICILYFGYYFQPEQKKFLNDLLYITSLGIYLGAFVPYLGITSLITITFWIFDFKKWNQLKRKDTQMLVEFAMVISIIEWILALSVFTRITLENMNKQGKERIEDFE